MSESTPMMVVEVVAPGGPEQLTLGRRPKPAPGAGEVLIRVEAAGVNRPDVLQRLGKYPPPPGASDVLGLEVAGEIVGVGACVGDLIPGQRVCALLAGGGYAEYAAAPAGQCLPVPDGLTEVEAASLPETAFTVWHNLIDHGGFQPGQTVLVHGGASGIGVMAIQMVAALGGRVIATAGSVTKVAACRSLGAEAIDYSREDFVAAVNDATAGKGVDIVLDMVGGDYLLRNMEAAAIGGRIVHIAFLRGAKPQIDLAKLMHKRLVITGSTLRGRSVETKAAIAEALRREVWPAIASGVIRPVVDSVFEFGRAGEAHRLMEASGHIGKIVLTPTGGRPT
jgi:putative PIG3 family NAD(P)H quinone oxidoreductase